MRAPGRCSPSPSRPCPGARGRRGVRSRSTAPRGVESRPDARVARHIAPALCPDLELAPEGLLEELALALGGPARHADVAVVDELEPHAAVLDGHPRLAHEPVAAA